jgi:hypothetical protein
VADWVTISSLATGAGTLVLAIATFGSVRSANRTARAAERSLLAGLRPLLMTSRQQDPEQKVGFADDKWFVVPGGGAVVEATDEAIYLTMSLRNVGSGLAVLHGWYFHPEILLGAQEHESPEDFHRLTRDIYVPAGDIGFWQGAFRDPTDPAFDIARKALENDTPVMVDLLYGDQEGGQRVITRCMLRPHGEGKWFATVARHWNIDREDPR